MSILEAEQDFAKRAAAHFLANPKDYSFTDEEIEPDALLALKWGVADQAVLVLRLSDSHTPTIYGDLISAMRNRETET